jgi:hypothetical protein
MLFLDKSGFAFSRYEPSFASHKQYAPELAIENFWVYPAERGKLIEEGL